MVSLGFFAAKDEVPNPSRKIKKRNHAPFFPHCIWSFFPLMPQSSILYIFYCTIFIPVISWVEAFFIRLFVYFLSLFTAIWRLFVVFSYLAFGWLCRFAYPLAMMTPVYT
ncbi:hypothetical protein B9Z19DRAFT_461670 [Tuber borchii]|uniref:Uncharacterized protein n=1 Tax=Tuber borchii TaxID=42251 RepID=A0A2T6ZFS5_TUBBO|nr:hypothetical protein B9Z19DRAFT_461670 [Tuber borchii]